MATKLEIINGALALLNEAPIADYTSTTSGKQAAAAWDILKDSVLRAHPWNCCIKRDTIVADVTAPEFGFSYQFTLPSDFVRALSIDADEQFVEYRIEDSKLLADVASIDLRYVYHADPSTWNEGLTAAVMYKIAGALAYPRTGSTSLAQYFEGLYAMELEKAKAADGAEDTQPDMPESSLITIRGI